METISIVTSGLASAMLIIMAVFVVFKDWRDQINRYYFSYNIGAFGILVWIRNRRPFRYTLDEIAGLSRTMPWTALRGLPDQ